MITFKKIGEAGNNVLVVDALNLAFRWKHQGATDFCEDYCLTVDSLKKSYKAKSVLITSVKGSSAYRKTIYPEYKQNRKDKFDLQNILWENLDMYFRLTFFRINPMQVLFFMKLFHLTLLSNLKAFLLYCISNFYFNLLQKNSN